MRITKLGHSCLLVEEKGMKLMTDPGIFTREEQERVLGLSAILITHEHADHFHAASLAAILKHNPGARVICNVGVGRILAREGIKHEVLEDGEMTNVGGIAISAFGRLHAEIHRSLPAAENTGFLIADTLWYPGDALFEKPPRSTYVALPISGPWMKIAEAIDYALAIKPELCFPVHDFILSEAGKGIVERVAGSILDAHGVRFLPLDIGREYDL